MQTESQEEYTIELTAKRIFELIGGVFGTCENGEYKKIANLPEQNLYFLHALFHIMLRNTAFMCTVFLDDHKGGPVLEASANPFAFNYFISLQNALNNVQVNGQINDARLDDARLENAKNNANKNPHSGSPWHDITKYYLRAWKNNEIDVLWQYWQQCKHELDREVTRYRNAYDNAISINDELKAGKYHDLDTAIHNMPLDNELKDAIITSVCEFYRIKRHRSTDVNNAVENDDTLQQFLISLRMNLYDGQRADIAVSNALKCVENTKLKAQYTKIVNNDAFKQKLNDIEPSFVESIIKFCASILIYVKTYTLGLCNADQNVAELLQNSRKYWSEKFRDNKFEDFSNDFMGVISCQ